MIRVHDRLSSRAQLTCDVGLALAMAAAVCVAAGVFAGTSHAAPSLPEIRTSAANTVPRCVTPERLMAFLKRRNGNLDRRFRDIASHYKRHGEAWHVRWDYAFFQMAIETNFLTYRAPNGRMGDVDPKQNNFAGIGTTGGGVPGDSFPDVSTGVLGQIQHLVVYSGETIANPVAPRTQLKQEHILTKSRALNRPVRFSDLARRWAADPKYASSIAWVAEQFRSEECKGRAPSQQEVLPWQQPDRGHSAPRAEAEKGPVRTVWRRGDPEKAKKSATIDAPKKKADTSPEPTANSGDAAPNEVAVVASAPAASKSVTEPIEEARFALFTPPRALAEAVIPKKAHATESRDPAPKAPRETDASQSADAPAIMGPPAPPQSEVAVAPLAVSPSRDAKAEANFARPSGLGVKPGRCVVETATFGGDTTVLVKSPVGADVHYIALSVLDGFEDSMTKSFLAARIEGGEALGTYPSKDAALAQARTLCPE